MGWGNFKPPFGYPLNRGDLLAKDLCLGYLLNEGSGDSLFDISGNKRTGALNDGSSWSTGPFGHALDMDGSADRIDLSAFLSGLPTGGESRTYTGWFNSAETGSTQNWIDHGTNAVGERISITANADTVAVSVGSYTWGITGLSLTGWHHFACVFPDGATTSDQFLVYLDNVLQSTSKLAGAGAKTVNTGTTYGYIGYGTATTDYYDGKLDVPLIWKRPLSASEIALLYAFPFAPIQAPDTSRLIVLMAGGGAPSGAITGTAAGVGTASGALTGTGALAGTTAGVGTASGALTDATADVAIPVTANFSEGHGSLGGNATTSGHTWETGEGTGCSDTGGVCVGNDVAAWSSIYISDMPDTAAVVVSATLKGYGIRLLARVNRAADTGYYADVRNSGNTIAVGKFTSGQGTVDEFINVAYTVSNGEIPTFVVTGGSLLLYIDDVLKLQTTDGTYSTGDTGLAITDKRGTWDDFSVTAYVSTPITGTVAGVGTATGSLTGTGSLSGTAAGVGTATGSLSAPGSLVGTAAGVGTASGVLTGTGALAGTAAGVGATTGTLTATGALAGTAAGTGTVTGVLTATGALAGTAAGVGTATGALTDANVTAFSATGMYRFEQRYFERTEQRYAGRMEERYFSRMESRS